MYPSGMEQEVGTPCGKLVKWHGNWGGHTRRMCESDGRLNQRRIADPATATLVAPVCCERYCAVTPVCYEHSHQP